MSTGGTAGGDAGFTVGGATGATAGSFRVIRDRVSFDISISTADTVQYDVTLGT